MIRHSFLIVQECMNKELCKNRTMKSNAVVNLFLPKTHADVAVNFKICNFQQNIWVLTYFSYLYYFGNVCHILNWGLAYNNLVAFILKQIAQRQVAIIKQC